MGKTFVEVIFEGHYNTVKGYLEGLRDGMGTTCKVFFVTDHRV